MTSAQVLDRPAVSLLASAHMPLAPIAARWILANVLPQALLVTAAAVYFRVNGISFAGLMTEEALAKLGNAGRPLLAVAVIYLAMLVWMRGAVLRPLVPRFSILGWLPTAFLSGVAMLVAAVGGGLVGVLIAKGIALTGNYESPAPSGFALAPFVLGQIIAAEIIGLILGGLPGLIFGTAEAFAACRGTRRIAAWIVWSAAASSTAVTIIALHGLLIVAYGGLPSTALAVLAVATPILIGLAAALLTLPVIAKLARQQRDVG